MFVCERVRVCMCVVVVLLLMCVFVWWWCVYARGDARLMESVRLADHNFGEYGEDEFVGLRCKYKSCTCGVSLYPSSRDVAGHK